ncbi:MAG: alpha-amylase, partial [Candidatus Saccharimonadales bacterium]
MKSIVLYLHVHQPYRIAPYSVFSAGYDHDYFSDARAEVSAGNEVILKKVAQKSYLPTNSMLLELLQKYPEFRLSLSITGTFIDQCEAWAP